jgi:hypothetical protein
MHVQRRSCTDAKQETGDDVMGTEHGRNCSAGWHVAFRKYEDESEKRRQKGRKIKRQKAVRNKYWKRRNKKKGRLKK